ncbi:MAG: DNA polymerase I, partial [Candidatus Marinimicrobia bacterium]|nr:DNA polymerase I [Candidatus Neomarinimicrobiota bacterium]
MMSSSGKKRLFLIDGHAMVYRAHFAMIRNPLITTDGRHTSALFGFINSMFKILRDENPEYIAIVFDSREKTFRHEMYPEYKATREKMPDELREQFPHLWRLVDAMNIPRLEMPGYEADDIIGSLASMAKNEGIKSYIVSGDKDFMQLVDEDIQIYSPGGMSKPTIIYDREKVIEKWGVTPEQIIDLLGLMGDSSDNVPGVAGVGKKTAVKLIEEYGSIEEALNHAEEVKNKRVREGLINGREVAILSKELVTILTDLPLSKSVDELERTDFNFDDLEDIFRDLEFFRLEKQLNDFRIDKVMSKIQEKNYMCVDTVEKFKLILESLKSAKLISMDIETTSKDPMRAEIVGLSFSIGVNEGWYIPIQFLGKDHDLFGEDDLDYVLSELKPIYEDPQVQKCGQNIKYDMLVLKNNGIEVQGVVFDTMIAAHLLKPE